MSCKGSEMPCMDKRKYKVMGQEARDLLTVMSLAVSIVKDSLQHDKHTSSSHVSDFGDSAHVGIDSVPKSPSKSSSGTSCMICGTLNQSSLGASVTSVRSRETIYCTSQTCSDIQQESRGL